MESRTEGPITPQEHATMLFRNMELKSGLGILERERIYVEALKEHLRLHLKESPEKIQAGLFLIAYISSSTHLRGLLEGKGQEAVFDQIIEHLKIKPGEKSEETFRRLSDVAIENSKKINVASRILHSIS